VLRAVGVDHPKSRAASVGHDVEASAHVDDSRAIWRDPGICRHFHLEDVQVLKAIGVRGVVVHLGRERHRQSEEGQSWNREKRDRARRDREADFQHRSTSCGCGQATDGGGLQVEIGVPA